MKWITSAASLLLIAGSVSLASCSGGASANATPSSDNAAPATDNASSQPQTSELKFDDVALTTPLDQHKVAEGKKIYEMKCQSCHKLTDEKLVGPGWKGVTQRRKPGWIITMATNPDLMLDKDPDAKQLLDQILVRMPNQNITKEDARNVLEFMRSNDGVK